MGTGCKVNTDGTSMTNYSKVFKPTISHKWHQMFPVTCIASFSDDCCVTNDCSIRVVYSIRVVDVHFP